MKLYYNGKIASMDGEERVYQAIGVKDGKIAFLGSDQEASALDCEERVDLKGKLMLPGFSDTHLHILHYGFFKKTLSIAGLGSIAEIVEQGKDYLKKDPRYILGMGWNQEHLREQRFPNKGDLDQITTERPICLLRTCGHIVAVNSYVTDRLSQMELPPEVRKNVDLENGILKETAMMLYQSFIPRFSEEEIEEVILEAVKDLNRCGITCIHSDDFKSLPGGRWDEVIRAYQKLESEGRLNTRVYEQCLLPDEGDFREFVEKGYRTEKAGDQLFRIGPRKFLQDGSLGGETAAMIEGYAKHPDNKGLPTYSQEELNRLFAETKEAGMQIATHCIGDQALNMTLQAFEEVYGANQAEPSGSGVEEDPRPGIVHAQITNPQLIERMSRQKAVAYIQPIFIDSDMEVVYDRIGRERAEQSYAWKSMIDAGVHCCGGSDAPVVSFNVMENIYSAVTRKNLAGDNVYLPEQKLSVAQAVRLFTSEAAYPCYDQKRRGTLELGKDADLTVLSRDLFTIPEDEIKDVEIELTVLAGRTVFEK